MTGPPDPDSRYTVLPQTLRHERRAGATAVDIQIARAHSYIARLEAELAPNTPGPVTPDRERKQRTLREWRAHLTNLRADAANAATYRHAAE